MRSLAELANLLAMPSGFWKRELLGAKPIAVSPLRDPSRTGLRSLMSVTLVLYRRRAPDKKRGEKQRVGARVR